MTGIAALDALLKRHDKAGTNAVHEAVALLEAQVKTVEAAAEKASKAPKPSPAMLCLRPALSAAGWTGHERHIQEALPHFDAVRDVDGLRAVLARLNFETPPVRTSLAKLDDANLPCLFTTTGEDLMVVLSREAEGLLVYDGTTGSTGVRPAQSLAGTAYPLLAQNIEDDEHFISKSGWINYVLRRFKPLIYNVLAISCLVNLTALVLPLFVMHVYDLGIGAKAESVVVFLFVGAGLVIAVDAMLRLVRSRAIGYFGARFDALLGIAAFQQLLHLPIHMTENAPITSQITRLKQFESLRDVFTGTLATALVDIPFIILFLIAIAAIGGHLVWIPVTLLVLYVVLALAIIPMTKLHVARSGEAKQRAQDLVMEMLSKRSAIRDIAAESPFLDRFAKAQQDFVMRNFQAQQFNGFAQNLSQTLVNVSGVATLGLGSLWVMNGQMSQGALISAMALVWRVLSPLQQSFMSLPRLEQSASTFQQVNKLMQLKLERKPGVMPSFTRSFQGNLTINRAVMRYPQRSDPALKGFSAAFKAGEIVAITGPSGCGKSSLLKVIAGLYPLQQGQVIIDGLDIRQIDTAEWRTSIGYVPEHPTFFYGTVAQNLRLGCPEATDEVLEQAADDAGLFDFANLLRDGLDTRLTGSLLQSLPEALIQRLMLARAYCRQSTIYVMDYPANNLDPSGDAALQRKLLSLKGKATVIFTTQRPSHMKLADRLIYMEEGTAVLDGPPEQVIARLPEVR